MENGFAIELTPVKHNALKISYCRAILSRLYFSKLMTVFYLILILLCVANILGSLFMSDPVSSSALFFSIEVAICVLIVCEIALRLYLKGVTACLSLGNCIDVTTTLLCVSALVLSVMDELKEELSQTTMDALVVFRNAIFIMRLVMVFRHNQETKVLMLQIPLDTEEKELEDRSSASTDEGLISRSKAMVLFEENETEEVTEKGNSPVWKGRKRQN
jgi:hypothetical protein